MGTPFKMKGMSFGNSHKKLKKKTKLKDLRDNDKNIDLDKGANMPVKRSNFGPSSNENLGNMMTRELEDKAE